MPEMTPRIALIILCLLSVAADKPLTPQTFSNLGRATGGVTTLSADVWTNPGTLTLRRLSGKIEGYGAVITCPLILEDCQGLVVRGVTFDGRRRIKGDQWFTPAIRIRRGSDLKFEDCDFTDGLGDFVYLEGGVRDLLMLDCKMVGAWRNAITVIEGHRLTFQRLTIDDVNGTDPMAGIQLETNDDTPPDAISDVSVIDSRIRNVGGLAIGSPGRVNRPARVTVRGCDLEGGVLLHGPDMTVDDTRVDANGRGRAAVAIRGPRPTVTDTDAKGGTEYSVWVAGPQPVASLRRPATQPVKVEAEE